MQKKLFTLILVTCLVASSLILAIVNKTKKELEEHNPMKHKSS